MATKKRERLHESLNGIVQTSGDPEFALKTILGIMTGFSSAEIDSLNLNLSDDKARSGIIDKLAKMKTNDEVMADKVADAFDYIQKNANSTPLVKIVAGELRRNDNNISPTEDPYYKRQAFKGFARQDADLLNTAHNPKIERVINSKLGTSLTDIPLASQVQLLKFMTEADNGRFDSLCSTLHGVKPELRLKLAEGFLAADFGEDFGDALLDIANSERITEEQLEKLLDQVKSCRESIAGITGLYEPIYKGEFAKQYARAANERLTDAIMVFREIAGKGQAEADLGWAGNVRLDYDEAMEALALEAKSLSTINGVMDDVRKGKEGCFAEMILSPDADHRRSYYNLYSPEHGYTLLYVRPEGSSSFDPTIEYGKYRSRYNEDGNNVGTEASISLIADPVDPFSQLNPFRPDRHKVRDPGYYDDDTMNKVSAIRLDREGRTPGAAADDPDRSPIAEEGMVSVDLAAIGDRFDTPSGKIARLVSAGNKIRQEANGHKSDFSLNHNVGWFDQDKYGKAGGFKEIAEYIDRNMRALCTLHPPKPGEGYAGEAEKLHRKELRAAQRERGRIAMRKFGQAA